MTNGITLMHADISGSNPGMNKTFYIMYLLLYITKTS